MNINIKIERWVVTLFKIVILFFIGFQCYKFIISGKICYPVFIISILSIGIKLPLIQLIKLLNNKGIGKT